jgi:hypothetical protein
MRREILQITFINHFVISIFFIKIIIKEIKKTVSSS